MSAPAYRLPPTLEPWRESLELFPEDLRSTLGAWLPRLAGAIGPFSPHRSCDSGAPDGFSGIEGRGPYERLLMSEWALAELYPDEFVRRAAMSEHSFYKLAYQEPGVSRRAQLLLDAGPDQLGGPRLAQLALLIIIENRTRRAGIELHWGLLQERRSHRGLSRATVVAFLGGRACREPDRDDLAAWSEILPMQADDECWMMGGPRAIALARVHSKAALVCLDDPLDPDEPSVRVEFLRGPGAGGHALLQLPPTAKVVRLLREPFAERGGAGASHAIQLSRTPRLTFASQRHRLFALAASGELVAFHIPNSPGGTPGRPRRFKTPKGEVVVAAQMRGRRLSIVTMRKPGGELVLRGVFGNLNNAPITCDRLVGTFEDGGAPLPAFAPPDNNDPLCSLAFDFFSKGFSGPILLDAAGSLYRWSSDAPEAPPEHIARNVLAIWPSWSRFVMRADDGTLQAHNALIELDGEREEPRTIAKLSKVIWVDASSEPASPFAVALTSSTKLTFLSPEGQVAIATLDGDRVLGIASHAASSRRVAVIDEDRRSVYLLQPGERKLLLELEGPALNTVLSPDGSHLASLSEGGHLQVYCFTRRALVLSDIVEVAP